MGRKVNLRHVGTTWQPLPGHQSDHLPVEINDQGVKCSREDEDEEAVEHKTISIEEDVGR